MIHKRKVSSSAVADSPRRSKKRRTEQSSSSSTSPGPSFLDSFVPEWSDRLTAWTFALDLATQCVTAAPVSAPEECKQPRRQPDDSKHHNLINLQSTACLTNTLCLDQSLTLAELSLLEVLFGGTRDKSRVLRLASPLSQHEFSARFTRFDTIVVHVNHSPRLSCQLEVLAIMAILCMTTRRGPAQPTTTTSKDGGSNSLYSLLVRAWREKSHNEARRAACSALLDWLQTRCSIKHPQKNVIWTMDRSAALATDGVQLLDIYNWCEVHVDADKAEGRVLVKLGDWEARVLCVHPMDDRKEISILRVLRVSMMVGPADQLPLEWRQDTHGTHTSAWRRVVVTCHETGKLVVGNTTCLQDAQAAVALLELLAQRAAKCKPRCSSV